MLTVIWRWPIVFSPFKELIWKVWKFYSGAQFVSKLERSCLIWFWRSTPFRPIDTDTGGHAKNVNHGAVTSHSTRAATRASILSSFGFLESLHHVLYPREQFQFKDSDSVRLEFVVGVTALTRFIHFPRIIVARVDCLAGVAVSREFIFNMVWLQESLSPRQTSILKSKTVTWTSPSLHHGAIN